MKVNRPGSPLSSGAEPIEQLDAQELQKALKGERFNAALAQLGAAAAVRESARFMVRSRLGEKFRDTEQASTLVERLSEFVASDPLLHSKLLGILQKVKKD